MQKRPEFHFWRLTATEHDFRQWMCMLYLSSQKHSGWTRQNAKKVASQRCPTSTHTLFVLHTPHFLRTFLFHMRLTQKSFATDPSVSHSMLIGIIFKFLNTKIHSNFSPNSVHVFTGQICVSVFFQQFRPFYTEKTALLPKILNREENWCCVCKLCMTSKHDRYQSTWQGVASDPLVIMIEATKVSICLLCDQFHEFPSYMQLHFLLPFLSKTHTHTHFLFSFFYEFFFCFPSVFGVSFSFLAGIKLFSCYCEGKRLEQKKQAGPGLRCWNPVIV